MTTVKWTLLLICMICQGTPMIRLPHYLIHNACDSLSGQVLQIYLIYCPPVVNLPATLTPNGRGGNHMFQMPPLPSTANVTPNLPHKTSGCQYADNCYQLGPKHKQKEQRKLFVVSHCLTGVRYIIQSVPYYSSLPSMPITLSFSCFQTMVCYDRSSTYWVPTHFQKVVNNFLESRIHVKKTKFFFIPILIVGIYQSSILFPPTFLVPFDKFLTYTVGHWILYSSQFTIHLHFIDSLNPISADVFRKPPPSSKWT